MPHLTEYMVPVRPPGDETVDGQDVSADPTAPRAKALAGPPSVRGVDMESIERMRAASSNVLHKTQGKWIVTHDGRVKMLHDGSSRTTAWEDELVSFPNAKLHARDFVVKHQDTHGHFLIEVNTRKGDMGFTVNKDTLCIGDLSASSISHTAVEDGDLVVAVNDQAVSSYAEFARLTSDRPSYLLTIRPCDLDVKKLGIRTSAFDDLPMTCIEFDVAEMCCREDAGTIRVPLRRVGDLRGQVSWAWKLSNCNVVPSVFKKIRTSGEAVFLPGSSTTEIEVDVPRDPTWNVESLVVLYLDMEMLDDYGRQDGVQVFVGDNTQVSLYSLNNVTFPAGAYGTFDNRRPPCSLWTLQSHFVMHNFTEIPRETKVGVALCFIPPILFYVKQLLFEIFINCALTPRGEKQQCNINGVDWTPVLAGDGTSSPTTLVVFAVALVVFRMLEHLVEVRYRILRLGGQATKMLRTNMFATLLQLSDKAKELFDDGNIEKCLDTEVETAVTCSWLNSFKVFQAILGLIFKMILAIRVASALPKAPALVLSATTPLILVLFVLVFYLRAPKQVQLKDHHLQTEQNWSAFTTMCSASSPLILSYRRGWRFTAEFGACHGEANKAGYRATVQASWTIWMLRYIAACVNALVLLYGGSQVQTGDLALGSYLVLFSSVNGFGKELISIVKLANTIVQGTAAVNKIALVLNGDTRRMDRYLKDLRRKGEDSKASDGGDDRMLELCGVSFQYADTQVGQGHAVNPTNLKIPVGHMICLPVQSMSTVGQRPATPGVHTLFSLISGSLLPVSGEVNMPARWRVIYVPVMPILFDGTLLYNLMFSDRAEDADAVWEVCRALGLSPGLIGKADFDVGSGGKKMKFSDRIVISIARALMHGVDLLLLSSGLDVLGEGHASKVLRFLRKYVAWRGLPHEEVPFEIRHLKTVLYTSKYKVLQDQAAYKIELPTDSA